MRGRVYRAAFFVDSADLISEFLSLYRMHIGGCSADPDLSLQACSVVGQLGGWVPAAGVVLVFGVKECI